MSDEALRQRIFASAEAHDGKHLLPRRPYRPIKYDPPTDLDREYEACDDLVASGHARWMTGNLSPGISLTGKPLQTHSPHSPPNEPNPDSGGAG